MIKENQLQYGIGCWEHGQTKLMMSEEAASLKVSLLQIDETLLGRALKKCNDMLTGENMYETLNLRYFI